MRTLLILRGTLAVIMTALAVVAFANGRVFFGVLLVAFAATNTALIVTIMRRRAGLARRFPGSQAPPA
jgi:hypothetical protein